MPRPDVDEPRGPRWHVGAPSARGGRHGLAIAHVSGLGFAQLTRRGEQPSPPAGAPGTPPRGPVIRP